MSIQKARAEIQRLRNKANTTMRSDACYETKARELAKIYIRVKELEAAIDKWGGFIL